MVFKMRGYSIEARSLKIAGIAGHTYWVLRDEHGNALAELHGLATERLTGKPIPIGTDEARHSLRAWHFPHDAAYASTLGARVDNISFIRPNQQSRTVAIGTKDEMLARWNTAVNALPALNAQDLNYPNYGFRLWRDTVNSNSAYRTFGELMNVPVTGFFGRLEPGLRYRILSQERTEALRYCTLATPLQTLRPPRSRRMMAPKKILVCVALLLAVLPLALWA